MTILEILGKCFEVLKIGNDAYVKDGVLPDMLTLLEKGYPAHQDVIALADKYPDTERISDVPDYHDIDNVFGEERLSNNTGVVGVGELVDISVKRENMPIEWRIAEVDLGDYTADFKAWHADFTKGLVHQTVK